jgi:predicted Mrr-cat superfamily restriction endonuclease
MNYWIHRISYEARASYPLLEMGFLSIGYLYYATEEFLEKSTNGDREYFDNEFQTNEGSLPRRRYSLWYFLSEIGKGDWIIVPGNRVFSIYEILEKSAILPSQMELNNLKDWYGNPIIQTDGFLVDSENKDIDIGFLRRVKLIYKDISRSEFADNSLMKRLKTQWTTSNVNDLEENIKKSIKRYVENKPINLKQSILESSVSTWLKIIHSDLDDRKFENLVRGYFLQIGCTDVDITIRTEPNKEGDVDVIASFEQLHTIIYVQAKHHDGETDEWAVEQVKEFASSKVNADDGYLRQYWVISSAESYSENAVRLAKENNVLLINGKEFVKMLILSGIQKVGEA